MLTAIGTAGLLVLGLTVLPASVVVAQSSEHEGATRPSTACGQVDVGGNPTSPLDVHGEPRSFRVLVPSADDGTTPLPLVIWLHGQGMDAASLEDTTDLASFAESHDVVLVAPEGHRPDSGWMWEPGTAEVEPGLENRDVAFVDALIDRLGTELCLDLARVYATGYSIGGYGASVLACRLSERIAAVVAAPMFADLGPSCAASRAVPMLAFHQTGDEYVLFDGGLGDFLADPLPWGTTKGDEPFYQRADWSVSTVERAESIAVRNGCGAGPSSETIAEGVERLSWDCSSGADIALIVVQGGGHDWMIEDGPDTNELMWAFLRQHSLPT